MELNKIRLLSKEEVLQKLKQSGFGEVAGILQNKDINGLILLELREFETIKWGLTPTQRKILWDCINKIKNKPSILMVRKPDLPRRSPSIRDRSGSNADSATIFKEKLQDVLGSAEISVGSSSTLPKMSKKTGEAKTKITNTSLSSRTNQNRAGVPNNKPLPPPPSPSPSPRNVAVKNTEKPIKKPALPDPPDQTYLEMNAPDYDGYLSPLNVPETVKNHLSKKIIPTKTITKNIVPKYEEFKLTKPSSTNQPFNKGLLRHVNVDETYESDNPYELSPNINNTQYPTKIARDKNKSRSIEDILGRPKKFEITTNKDEADNYEEFPTTSNNLGVCDSKVSLKDLVNNGALVDENEPQQEPLFSYLTSKLNIFKIINKSRNVYENYFIKGETSKTMEVAAKGRPLPEIPVSPIFPAKSLFFKPFPPPRNIFPDSDNHDNYVELTNTLPHHVQSFVSQKTNKLDEEWTIFENTSKTDSLNEEQQIYENTSNNNVIYGNLEEINDNKSTSNVEKKSVPLKFNEHHSSLLKQKLKERDQERQNEEIEDNKSISNVETKSVPLKFNEHHSSLVQLLKQKLKERDQERQNEEIEGTETDSEFDDDLPIYGNISNNNEHESSFLDDKDEFDIKIPFSKGNTIPPPLPIKNVEPNRLPSAYPENKQINFVVQADRHKPRYRNYENQTVDHQTTNSNQGTIPKSSKEKNRDSIFNINAEPFYRDIDRKGAKQLLSKLENGTFLFRPSRNYFLVLTVKHNGRIYNFGIERSTNNMLRLNTEGNIDPPEFSNLSDFVSYFMREPVTFEDTDQVVEIRLKKTLPANLF